jgi:GNAT superfamily N-acetyltransferase
LQDISITYIPPSGNLHNFFHSWIAHLHNGCVGRISMWEEPIRKLKFTDAWVHENHRRQGIYRKLWDKRWDYVQKNHKGYTVYAWCKPMSLPLLLEKGFEKGDPCVYVEKKIAK